MWTVYIVECSDKTLYTGITNNLQKRIDTHNCGKGAKYTRSRRPVKLVDFLNVKLVSDALKIEARIKKLKKDRKVKKIRELKELYEDTSDE